MAKKSEFLPFQDANNDGLSDVCPEIPGITEPKVCPECAINPQAIVPNWRTRTLYEPFLNERTSE